MPSELHITNGDASGGIVLRAANVPPENLLVYWDQLSCGPWIEFEELEEWNEARQEFARSLDYRECFGLPEGADNYRYGLLLDADKLAEAENIFLWLGSGLSDQLLMVWLVRYLHCIGVDVQKLHVVQFQRVPGVECDIVHISMLNPETDVSMESL